MARDGQGYPRRRRDMMMMMMNVAYIKEKETDEVNKMCAEFQKKKCVLGAVENGTRDAHCVQGERRVLNATIKTIFLDIVKINKGETSHYIQETHDMLLLSTRYSNYKPYTCKLELNGVQCEMEIDTGCSSTLINKRQFDLLPYAKLSKKRTILRLRTNSGGVIIPNGVAGLKVKYQGKIYDLKVLVVPGSGPNLLGRDCRAKLPMSISATCNQIEWTDLNQEFAELFKPDLGTLKIATEKLYLKQNSTPRFMKARSVPLTIREKVEVELERMVATSVIKPVCFSEWASPIAPVLKRNGQVRICGDFKQTVNPVLQIDKYPIPKIDNLYSKVSGKRYFTRLDLSVAYLQVPLDEESQKLTMINTHKGLFMYIRLCFGIASSPGVF